MSQVTMKQHKPRYSDRFTLPVGDLLENATRLHQSGKLQQAEQLYREILRRNPNHADALHLLGVTAHQKGNNEIAIECIKGALRLSPSNAAFHLNLGNALKEMGRFVEALDSYREALRLKPQYAEACFNLGNTLQALDHLEEAAQCYREATRIKPLFGEAYSNLSVVLFELGMFDEGLKNAQTAVQLQPHNPFAQNNLGNLLKVTDDYQQAERCYLKAIQLKPDFAEPYSNLGSLYLATRDLDKASYWYNQALEIEPDLVEARWSRALLFLLTGRLKEGWVDYEWRWKRKDFIKIKRHYFQAEWDGSPVPDKTVLLYAEQGLGDTIQFIRYALLVRPRVKKVIVEAQPSLTKLLTTCPGVDQVIPTGSTPPKFDLHLSLLSLPRIFNTELHNIPNNIPYLSVPAKLKTDTSLITRVGNQLRVGMVWAGNPDHKNDRNRSCSISHFVKLQEITNVALFSLQKGPQRQDLLNSRTQTEIVDLGGILNDFSDTAAIMKELDLIITVDTAAAHLAGALGKAVWLLLPFTSDWRWMMDRNDTPWYPSMQLIRQTHHGDWEGVFRRVVERLSFMAKKWENYKDALPHLV